MERRKWSYKKNVSPYEDYVSIKCSSSITDVTDHFYTGTFEFIGVGDETGDTVIISEGTFRVHADNL